MKSRATFLLLSVALASSCNQPSRKPQGESDELAWENVPHARCNRAQNQKLVGAVANRERLRLQLPWFPNGEHSYAYLGGDLGIFAFHGFDVTIQAGKGSDVAARSLAAGSEDAAVIGGDALVLVNQEGGDLRSLGAVYDETPVTIYSLAEKNITRPDQLYGKRLGLMPGSNTFTQYHGWANMASDNAEGKVATFDRKRVTEVVVPAASAPAMILAGESQPASENTLDALVHYTQFEPLQARGAGHNVNEIRLSSLPGVKIYGMLLAVRDGHFNRDQLYRLKAAVYDSFMCSKADPQASINALDSANPGAGFGTAQGTDKQRGYAVRQLGMMIDEMACKNRGAACEGFLSQNDDYWNATEDTLIKFKLLKDRPALDKLRIKLD